MSNIATDKSGWYNGYAGPTPDYIRDLVIEQIENNVVWDWRFSIRAYDYQGNFIRDVISWTAQEQDARPHTVEAAYLIYANKRYKHPTAVEIEVLGDTAPEIVPPARYWATADHQGEREECQHRREMLWTRPDGAANPARVQIRGLLDAAKMTASQAADFLDMSKRNVHRWTTGDLRISWYQYHYIRIMTGLDPEWSRK